MCVCISLNIFISVEERFLLQKKVFPLFCFEAKITQLMRSEKLEAKNWKRKEAKNLSRIFQVNKRNTCDTDPISLYFAHKRKNFFCETGAPYSIQGCQGRFRELSNPGDGTGVFRDLFSLQKGGGGRGVSENFQIHTAEEGGSSGVF
jgi:hypothetical protein